MAGPGVLAAIAGGTALLGGIYSAYSMRREAEKNRAFQKEMSDTAHQRAVRDMRLAGLNPMLAAGNAASSPSGAVADVPDFSEVGSKAVATALAVKQARENIILTRANTQKAIAEAGYTQNQSKQISEGGLVHAQRGIDIKLSELDLAQRRNLFAPVIAKAYAEVDQIGSASRAANARAALDEFARRGAMNEAEVQELISRYPEFMRLFGPFLGKLATGGVAGAAAGALLRKRTVVNKIQPRR